MKNEELYQKYPHIIVGSVESVDRGQTVIGGKKNKWKSHGKICVINCENATNSNIHYCLKTRIINVQDAEQVKFCTTCTRYNRNSRRRTRRRETKK